MPPRRSTQNQNNNQENQRNNNVNNQGGNEGGMNQLAQTLAQLVQNQQPTQRNLVTEFKRLNPPIFEGTTDPLVVDKWLQEMEKAFDLLGSNAEQKVTLATYQLQGAAYDWWLMEKRRINNSPQANQPYTWATFKEVFKDKYFPRIVRAQLVRDFIRLEQGEKQTVSEYEAEFARLAKYAPSLVVTEQDKAHRFEDGLRKEIRRHVAAFELPTYKTVVNKALVVERGELDAVKEKDSGDKKRGESSGGAELQGGPTKKPNSSKKGGQVSNLKCSRCGRTNHIDKDCRWNTGACLRCGDLSHKIADCPMNQKDKDSGNKATLAALGPTYGRVFRLPDKPNN